MSITVHQTSTLRWDFIKDLQGAAEAGFDGVGIFRRKLEDFGIHRAQAALEDSASVISSLAWAGGFTGSDGLTNQEAHNDAVEAITAAAQIRAPLLVIYAGGLNNHIRRHAEKTLIVALGELGEVAMRHDVQLAIEPVHPGCGDEWSFVSNIRGALDIVTRVNEAEIGIVCDLYHLGLQDHEIDWIDDLMPRLSLVQIADARSAPMGEMNRCLLGEGIIPIESWIDRLQSAGYQGDYEVELVGEDLDGYEHRHVLQHTRDFLDRIFG